MSRSLAEFREQIDRLRGGRDALFEKDREIVIARAPGRLDVMGGIADYSGSLVLEWPIRESCFVAIQRDPERRIRVKSPGRAAADFAVELSALEASDGPQDYRSARELFRRDPETAWAGYVAGAFCVLARERGIVFEEGARLLVSSEVPEGKGVSSSAAVEVAAMAAVAAAFELHLEPEDLAHLCQTVENRVVGAPCGIMDQMTSACGREGHLLALLCQPAQLVGSIPAPEAIRFFGIDSGVKRSVAGPAYGAVRTAAFMGYRMLAAFEGLAVCDGEDGLEIEDPRWHGYLANLDPDEFERSYRRRFPERISGAEFLREFRSTTDSVTSVAAEQQYAVQSATAHPVHEHARVSEFQRLLKEPPARATFVRMGELMLDSHESYSACGLGSDGTDLLVELVLAAGPDAGLFGARITGGGSGGTVAVLAARERADSVERVRCEYSRRTGRDAYLFRGSSGGVEVVGRVTT
ncbi:MAG: galactokinase family protein [Planctomycetota bacterium]